MPRAPRLLLCLAGLVAAPAGARAAGPSADFFEKQVRPLLVEHCQTCHGEKKVRGGLKLTSRAHILKGGDSGPAAVPGKPEKSLLVQAVRYHDALRMPPKQKLPDRDAAVLARWVQLGLPWPETGPGVVAGGATFRITDEQRRFWSFQPVRPAAPPAVRRADWARNPIDIFVLARLEEKGLRPAAEADRRTLIRRVTIDLTGLPPTPEEVDAFLADTRPGAYERVVDRLLASPAYGERYGRHWLDLVRYTDSFDARGLGGETDCADAWRYRDWVVSALNRGMPYDRFLTYQIAGDVVFGGREGVVATGMLAIGNWGGGDADKEKLLTDIADDQLDVVARTFLGLTVACARCHDHKFDPISTADYYALAGIFFSTHILPNVGPKTNGPPMLRVPLLSPAELARRREHQQRLVTLEKQLAAARTRAYAENAKAQLAHTARYLVTAYEIAETGADVEAVAARKGLLPYALRQWRDQFGGGEYRLLPQTVRNVGGHAGVFAHRGAADCPNALVNTRGDAVTISTLKLPPRSVAVHPGPNSGVAVAWRSPVAGKVRVRGRLADADPNCGDGVAWAIEHNRGGARRELAQGEFGNGGAQAFAAERLREIEVRPGDRLELLVLPRANHFCDTTVVEWVIETTDGARRWGLADEVVPSALAGKSHPYPDRQGNAGVWHFLDMAPRRPGARLAGLEAWERTVAAVRAGKGDRLILEAAARAAQASFTIADKRSPFWINQPGDERYLSAAARAELARLEGELDRLRRTTLPAVEYANGAQEGGVPSSPHAGTHDVRVHVRGRYDRLGPVVPRRFPEVLAGAKQAPIAKGSGRRELAEWLTRPDHPLTARVMVNRLWQWHFDEGIVRTPSNFGALGTRPSHPELLDWLAAELVRSGWDLKHLHRLIVLSSAYRQSCTADVATQKADPDNRLFGRMSRRRLEAEPLRDHLLAVAGQLDRTMGGLAFRDFNAPRRGLYYMTVRSDRSGFGPLFDSADSTAPVEKRTESTVAPQALFLLNNPFAAEQAKALARRVLNERSDEAGRIARAYALVYGRPPSAEEVAIGRELLSGGRQPPEQAWAGYCQVLLCANEFLYVD
jgi:hypothetical protein